MGHGYGWGWQGDVDGALHFLGRRALMWIPRGSECPVNRRYAEAAGPNTELWTRALNSPRVTGAAGAVTAQGRDHRLIATDPDRRVGDHPGGRPASSRECRVVLRVLRRAEPLGDDTMPQAAVADGHGFLAREREDRANDAGPGEDHFGPGRLQAGDLTPLVR